MDSNVFCRLCTIFPSLFSCIFYEELTRISPTNNPAKFGKFISEVNIRNIHEIMFEQMGIIEYENIQLISSRKVQEINGQHRVTQVKREFFCFWHSKDNDPFSRMYKYTAEDVVQNCFKDSGRMVDVLNQRVRALDGVVDGYMLREKRMACSCVLQDKTISTDTDFVLPDPKYILEYAESWNYNFVLDPNTVVSVLKYMYPNCVT